MEFFESFTSGRYHSDMKILKTLASNCKHLRIYGVFLKMANWCALNDILGTSFLLITSVPNNLWSQNFTRVCFLTQKKLKMTSKLPYCLLVLRYRKIQSKLIIQCISVKEKAVALFFKSHCFKYHKLDVVKI